MLLCCVYILVMKFKTFNSIILLHGRFHIRGSKVTEFWKPSNVIHILLNFAQVSRSSFCQFFELTIFVIDICFICIPTESVECGYIILAGEDSRQCTIGWALFWKFWTIKKLIKPLKDIYPWITKLVSDCLYTANMCSEITVKTQLKTVKQNYSFFTVTWTSILPYIVQCRSVDSSLQLLHCTWSSNQM